MIHYIVDEMSNPNLDENVPGVDASLRGFVARSKWILINALGYALVLGLTMEESPAQWSSFH